MPRLAHLLALGLLATTATVADARVWEVPRATPMPDTLLGPIGLLVTDARPGGLAEDEVDVGRRQPWKRADPMVADLAERVAEAGRSRGLWLDPDGKRTHPLLDVRLVLATCRRSPEWECTVEVAGAWVEPDGTVGADGRWTGTSAAASPGSALQAALDAALAAMSPWVGTQKVQWAAQARPAPVRLPAVVVEVRDGGGRPDLRLSAWPEGADRCVVEAPNGELRLVESLDILSVTHLQVVGVEPGERVWIARAGDRVVGVEGEWEGHGWYVRAERGLALVPHRELGPRSRLPPPNHRAEVCGVGADLDGFARGSETSYSRSHLTSSGAVQIVDDLRAARPSPEAHAAFHGGIGLIVLGGITLATSFIAPIDGCYQVEGPCNSFPLAGVVVPIGAGLLSAGIPLMVTGAARGGARPR